MKAQILVATLLIVIGIFAFVYQGISYTTTEKALDVGSYQADLRQTHTIPLPTFVGGVAMVGGILVLAAGRKYV